MVSVQTDHMNVASVFLSLFCFVEFIYAKSMCTREVAFVCGVFGIMIQGTTDELKGYSLCTSRTNVVCVAGMKY